MRALVFTLLVLLSAPALAADHPALRRVEGKYLFDLMKNAEFRAIAQKAAGPHLAEFRQLTGTAVPAELIEGRYLFAQGCKPHDCASHGAVIAIDTRTGDAVVAMAHLKRTRANPFVSYAAPKDWEPPPPLARRIEQWRRDLPVN